MLAVAFLVLAASSVRARAQEPRPKPKYGDIRVGPLYLSMRMTFTAGADSNVYNTPAATSDEAFTVRPTLEAVLPLTRRARIKANGGIVPYYFHKEASERHTDRFGNVLGEVDIGPLTAFGGVGGGRYRSRFSLEIDERLQRRESSNIMGATARLGRRIAATGSRKMVTTIFDPEATLDGSSVSNALDRDSRTYHFDLVVPVTRKTSVVPFVDTIEDTFVNSPPGVVPRVKSARYAAALEFAELAFVTGRVAAGVRHFREGSGVNLYDGLYLDINASMPFLFSTGLQLLAQRDVQYSASLPPPGTTVRTTYVESRYQATVSFELPWKLHGRAFVAYTQAKYRESSRRDHAWTEGGALLRHFGEHFSLGVIAQHVSRVSTVEGRTYDGNIYGLTGEVRF